MILNVTKEPVSHVAIQVGSYVMHSDLLGVHIVMLETFIKTHSVVYEIEQKFDENALMKTFAECDQKHYDYGGFIYLGLTYLIPWLPKKNLWRSSGAFLCTDFVSTVEWGEANGSLSAYQLYLKLKSQA